MSKLRKFIMGFVFALIVVMGVNAGSNNVEAATTKNFKGNLNVTYKNSEWNSKITIKKVTIKKVSIRINSPAYENYSKFTGKIISKDTIKVTDFPNVRFKWKDKTHFTSVRKGNGFGKWTQYFRGLCYSLNNTKYTQVKKSSTVYYCSEGNPYRPMISIKGNTITTKGNLTKGTKKSYAKVKGAVTKLKSANRTFKLSKSIKFYGNGGEDPNPTKISKNDAKSVINSTGKQGTLPFILTVKNGKVTRIDFYS